MFDVYPVSIADFFDMQNEKELYRDREWYFDAVKHFELTNGSLKFVYGGSRSRLLQKYRIGNFNRPFKSTLRQLKGKVVRYNVLQKCMLIKMPKGGYIRNTHYPGFAVDKNIVLPFEHYKISGSIFQRARNIRKIIDGGGVTGNSGEYSDLIELLSKMKKNGECS